MAPNGINPIHTGRLATTRLPSPFPKVAAVIDPQAQGEGASHHHYGREYGLRIRNKWLCYVNDATFNFELEGLKIANGGMMHSRLFRPVRLTYMPVVSVL